MLGIFRSKYPTNLAYSMAGVRNWADLNPSLARVLRSRGFATVAVVPSDIFDCGEESLSSSEGFDAQAYPLTPAELWHNQAITSPAVSEMAKGFLETYARRDLFLWVHYFDPHQIYNAHPGFGGGTSDFDRYRSEVRFTDHHLGAFLDHVTRRFGKDRVSICVVADHGEAFGEHGTYFHGGSFFEEEVRVPFVMKLPSVPPATVEAPVSLIDVAPTLLASLGMDPPAAWQGQDLVPLAMGDASAYRGAAFLNMEPFRGIVEWPHKMIWNAQQNWIGVYDLVADPGERKNLYAPGGAISSRLKRRLEEWIEAELNPWIR
jgi:arylsulfatase A-like enzyme